MNNLQQSNFGHFLVMTGFQLINWGSCTLFFLLWKKYLASHVPAECYFIPVLLVHDALTFACGLLLKKFKLNAILDDLIKNTTYVCLKIVTSILIFTLLFIYPVYVFLPMLLFRVIFINLLPFSLDVRCCRLVHTGNWKSARQISGSVLTACFIVGLFFVYFEASIAYFRSSHFLGPIVFGLFLLTGFLRPNMEWIDLNETEGSLVTKSYFNHAAPMSLARIAVLIPVVYDNEPIYKYAIYSKEIILLGILLLLSNATNHELASTRLTRNTKIGTLSLVMRCLMLMSTIIILEGWKEYNFLYTLGAVVLVSLSSVNEDEKNNLSSVIGMLNVLG